MPYEFFLSYTRANNDPYLKPFFEAVSEVIRERRGAPQTEQLGFFDQRELELGGARGRDPYVDVGGADWKPFFPENRTRVHTFLQNFVSNDELGFSSDELPFGPNLVAEIDDAWRRRQIVVVIVDGWSVHWDPRYRDVLKRLDERLDYHWCVLVPWNERDADSVAHRQQIQAAISLTFDRHANLAPNPMFFRTGIGSADELKAALREVLTRLKEEIKKRAPVDMPVPAGPSKAVILGPSAQG